MKKLILLLSSLSLIFGTNTFAEVKIKDTGFVVEKVESGPHKEHKNYYIRQIDLLREGHQSYSLRYSLCADPEYHAGPVVVQREGGAGLGLSCGGCWYGGDWIGLPAGGIPRFKIVEEGKRGIVDVRWESTVLRLIALDKEDKLYLEITRVKGDPLNIGFMCIPGHDRPEVSRDRWVSTSQRNIQHQQEDFSLNEKENWLYYFDTKGNVDGTCALMYEPDKVAGVKLDTRSNSYIVTRFDCLPDIQKTRFILWKFPKEEGIEKPYKYLKENEGQFLESFQSSIWDIPESKGESYGETGISVDDILKPFKKEKGEDAFEFFKKQIKQGEK